jgi:hypothetical protein
LAANGVDPSSKTVPSSSSSHGTPSTSAQFVDAARIVPAVAAHRAALASDATRRTTPKD